MTAETEKVKKMCIPRRACRTPERLKEVAPDVLSGRAIDAVTVEGVTDRAAVGKGVLCQHFGYTGEIEQSVGPLRRVFVRSLCTFLVG